MCGIETREILPTVTMEEISNSSNFLRNIFRNIRNNTHMSPTEVSKETFPTTSFTPSRKNKTMSQQVEDEISDLLESSNHHQSFQQKLNQSDINSNTFYQ